jgi:hypothetical protein
MVDASKKPNQRIADDFFQHLWMLEDVTLKECPKIRLAAQKYDDINSIPLKMVTSLVYVLYGYSLHYPQYFVKKILPVFMQQLKFLTTITISKKEVTDIKWHFEIGLPKNSIIKMISNVLLGCVCKEEQTHKYLKECIEEVQESEGAEGKFRHIDFLQKIFEYSSCIKIKSFEYVPKMEHLKLTIKLPQDLLDFNK